MVVLWHSFGFRPLLLPLIKKGGRNNTGRITVFHKGGGCKQKIRLVDFKRTIFDIFGIVKRIEYDPIRNCFLGLIFYSNFFLFSYILLPEGLRISDSVISSFYNKFNFNLGNAMPLTLVVAGLPLHNIEIRPGKGGQLLRSAGMRAFLINKLSKIAFISIQNKRTLKLLCLNLCTIGQVSNINYIFLRIKKAGISRLRGKRPTVRGVAMNPIDHPHGGGEGKTSGGRHPVSPWGRLTKGPKTRKGSFNLTKDRFISNVKLNDAF